MANKDIDKMLDELQELIEKKEGISKESQAIIAEAKNRIAEANKRIEEIAPRTSNINASSNTINKTGISVTDEYMDSSTEVLIKEALTVVNDFLNIGSDASIFAEDDCDFRGHIIYTPDARPPYNKRNCNHGFYIELHDTGDLSIKAKKYPKMLIKNPDLAERYHEFIAKYGSCYDPSERGYVYKTRATVPLRREDQRAQLHGMLSQQIAKNCPLADFSGNLLYTKNVYR